jgi:para-aminobenzoate synthetase
MGFVSYEAGLAGISITADSFNDDEARPDISFVLVLRSVVVDHERKIFYTQSIGADDGEWVLNTSIRISKLDEMSGYESPVESSFNLRALPACSIGVPDYQSYLDKVGACDVAIRAGDSYELCLTNQIKVKVSKHETRNHESSWNLYKKLSERNTAPFGVYLGINHGDENLIVIGSSPERFMSWSRKGKCQFRPIKGTVKKLPGMTLNDACEILRPSLNSKDVAENLMITDLVRHDLNGIVQLGSVHVPKLFEVEEYKTVFQLVSVIEGQLQQLPKNLDIFQHPNTKASSLECPNSRVNSGLATPDSLSEITSSPTDSFSNHPNHPRLTTGIDVLAASLPPGSMTGAPKKRSCEILQDIEEHIPRGIYSGVIGYLDVGGGGDFSVVIRTAWKWSGDDSVDEEGECEIWRVGAGGAVTSQSTPEGEADEMQTKLSSVTTAFRVLTSEPNREL